MKKWLLAACIIPSCFAVAQEEQEALSTFPQASLNDEYSSFFSQVRKLQDEDNSVLQFAFGFKHVTTGDLCHISSAYIHTQKLDIPLTVSSEQRFTVPSEKALKMANATVALVIEEPVNQCDMSVQLETTPQWLKMQYSVEDIETLYQQYQTFFDDMGSFLSFLMPSVDGMIVHFADTHLNQSLDNGLNINDGRLVLEKSWLDEKKSLSLPAIPLRITARTTK
jgi:hypothetical protein